MLKRQRMHVDDVKLLNCAACERELLGAGQDPDALPAGFTHLDEAAGRVHDRPVCPDCFERLGGLMWCLERVHRTGEIELLAYAQTERQAIEFFRQVRVGEYGPGLWKAPATCYMRIRGFDISAGDPLREGRRLCTSSS